LFDLLGFQPQDRLAGSDLRPLWNCFLDDQSGEDLGAEQNLGHLLGLEDPLQVDLHLERPGRHRMRLRRLGIVAAGHSDGHQPDHHAPHASAKPIAGHQYGPRFVTGLETANKR
jgi:hypothetical protein